MIRDRYCSRSARYVARPRWGGMSSGSQWLSFVSQAHLAAPVVGQIPHDFFPNNRKAFPRVNAHCEDREAKTCRR